MEKVEKKLAEMREHIEGCSEDMDCVETVAFDHAPVLLAAVEEILEMCEYVERPTVPAHSLHPEDIRAIIAKHLEIHAIIAKHSEGK